MIPKTYGSYVYNIFTPSQIDVFLLLIIVTLNARQMGVAYQDVSMCLCLDNHILSMRYLSKKRLTNPLFQLKIIL